MWLHWPLTNNQWRWSIVNENLAQGSCSETVEPFDDRLSSKRFYPNVSSLSKKQVLTGKPYQTPFNLQSFFLSTLTEKLSQPGSTTTSLPTHSSTSTNLADTECHSIETILVFGTINRFLPSATNKKPTSVSLTSLHSTPLITSSFFIDSLGLGCPSDIVIELKMLGNYDCGTRVHAPLLHQSPRNPSYATVSGT